MWLTDRRNCMRNVKFIISYGCCTVFCVCGILANFAELDRLFSKTEKPWSDDQRFLSVIQRRGSHRFRVRHCRSPRIVINSFTNPACNGCKESSLYRRVKTHASFSNASALCVRSLKRNRRTQRIYANRFAIRCVYIYSPASTYACVLSICVGCARSVLQVNDVDFIFKRRMQQNCFRQIGVTVWCNLRLTCKPRHAQAVWDCEYWPSECNNKAIASGASLAVCCSPTQQVRRILRVQRTTDDLDRCRLRTNGCMSHNAVKCVSQM